MRCPFFSTSYLLSIFALIPVPVPPFLFSSFGDTATRTPSLSSDSPPLSLILPQLKQGAPYGRLYPHSVNGLCLPSTSSPLLVHCTPTSVRHYKMPLVLALLLHSHPLKFEAELRDPVVIRRTRSSVRGDGVIQKEEGIQISVKKVQVPFWLVWS